MSDIKRKIMYAAPSNTIPTITFTSLACSGTFGLIFTYLMGYGLTATKDTVIAVYITLFQSLLLITAPCFHLSLDTSQKPVRSTEPPRPETRSKPLPLPAASHLQATRHEQER